MDFDLSFVELQVCGLGTDLQDLVETWVSSNPPGCDIHLSKRDLTCVQEDMGKDSCFILHDS